MLITLDTKNGNRDIDIPYEAMEDPILMNKIINVLLEEDDEDEYDESDYDELFFSESDEEEYDDSDYDETLYFSELDEYDDNDEDEYEDEYEDEDEDDDGDMFPNGEDDKESYMEYWMNH